MTTGYVVTLVLVDSAAWLIIHLGVAYVFTQLPGHWFDPSAVLFRERGWERGGRLYRDGFRVARWKHMLPDGAAWFRGGFRKAGLASSTPAYLQRFVRETCRGELVHWIVFLCAPLFFLWNPWPVGVVMLVYAAAANLPCILVQRYNRIRIVRLARARQRAAG